MSSKRFTSDSIYGEKKNSITVSIVEPNNPLIIYIIQTECFFLMVRPNVSQGISIIRPDDELIRPDDNSLIILQ